MELLEGETLRDRLNEGALPPRKAVELARQIARGLGAAHERGIVHRDLKPENIFLTRDGHAKSLDFGLAADRGRLDQEADDAGGLTRTSLTVPGAVLGTVGYMAPEQVRGETVDHRADIFAFGSVLHEMLSGRRAFDRDTAAETMTAILREEPPHIERGSGEISPTLERVVQRCLEKNRDERFQSARDLAFAIDTSGSGSAVESAARGPLGTSDRSRSGRSWVVTALASGIALALGFGLASALRGTPSTEPVRVRAMTMSGTDSSPSASPDGKIVAFMSARNGMPRIWIRQVAGGGEQPLTDGPDIQPRFSPDGATLLFLRDEGGVSSVYRQALVGGQPKKLVEDVAEAAWSPDGTRIAFSRAGAVEGRRFTSLGLADAQDGSERILGRFDTVMAGLHWAPDGSSLIGVEGSIVGNIPDATLVRIDVGDGSVERLRVDNAGRPLSSPVFTRSGEIVVAIAGSLLGDQSDPLGRIVRFDPDRETTSTLFWTTSLFPLQGLRADFTTIDILGDGQLIFHRNTIRSGIRTFDLAAAGASPSSRIYTRGESRDRQPAYSPDGRRVLFSSNRSGNLDLWTFEIASGEIRQLTDDAAQDWDPAFTPDGRQIVWSSDRSGHLEIWIAEADGSAARQLSSDGSDAENPTVTRDGEWVVYWSANPDRRGIWKVRTDGSDSTQLQAGPFVIAEVSPDGRHVAFIDFDPEALRNVVYVAEVETGELVPFRIEVPVPLRAALLIFGRMRWMPDGKSLAYVGIDDANRTGIYVQDFVSGKDTSATRRPLAGFSNDYTTESFGISPDGRAVAITTVEEIRQIMVADGVPGIERPR